MQGGVYIMGCQGGAVVSISTSHRYDPGLIPSWAYVRQVSGRSQHDSGFFLPSQIDSQLIPTGCVVVFRGHAWTV